MSMPKIGVNMTDGTVTEWYVSEGDEVKFGEMALAAETDKDVQDIPADQTGVVLKIVAEIGDNVECHKALAIVGAPGENIDDLMAQIGGKEKTEVVSKKEVKVSEESLQDAETKKQEPTGKTPVSPLAKKMAKDRGINLADVSYAGIRVTKSDILAYDKEVALAKKAAAPSLAAASTTSEVKQTTSYSGMRKKIGDRLTESVVTKPWAAMTVAVDMTETIAWRKRINETADIKVGFNELIAKACARALQKYPQMNSQLASDGDQIVEMEKVNIGIAVNTERGLLVPVLKDVVGKGVVDLSKEFKAVVNRTIEQTNISGDLSGGTFTISNLGVKGVSNFRAIINPPECGILAVSTTFKTPVVIDDEVAIRPMMNITLSFDHRIVDGAYASDFVVYIGKLLEDPMKILM